MSGTKSQINTLAEDLENLRLTDFKLLGLLGDGAYGEVWKARHKLTGQFFALKIVAKEKVSSMLSQFQREISILSSISHPNIIKLYQHFEDSSFYYLVMELAENGTLRDKISVLNPLTETEIQTYFWQILLAVEYLHSHVPPIIHRDVKPENVMFDNNNILKLCDFGFSNYYDQERRTSCGTLEYLSPEIVEKRGHDTSVDIWSLGILLYEMYTGVTPFSDGSNQQVLMNISKSILRVPLNIPPLAKDLISLMLDRNQNRRFTALEIKQHRWLLLFNQTEVEQKDSFHKEKDKKSAVFSQDSFLLAPSPKEVKTSIAVSLRKSINSMKKQIQSRTSGVKNTKTLVSKHRTMLSLCSEKLREIEKQLELKKNKFSALSSKEKILLSQIKDADYDISRMMNVCEVGVFKQKVLDLREELDQKEKEFEIQSEILKNLRQQVKLFSISMIEKDEELREQRKNLNTLHESSIKSYTDTEIQVRELKEYLNILKTKLFVCENPTPLVGQDQKHSEEIVNFIGYFMENESDGLSLSLKRLLFQSETKSKNLEKKMLGLKTEYSEEREKIINQIKRKKDHFFNGLKRQQFQDFQKAITENQVKESDILSQIEKARLKENEKCAELLDIAIARNRLYALKKDIQELEYKIGKTRILRSDLQNLYKKNLKKIEKVRSSI